MLFVCVLCLSSRDLIVYLQIRYTAIILLKLIGVGLCDACHRDGLPLGLEHK